MKGNTLCQSGPLLSRHFLGPVEIDAQSTIGYIPPPHGPSAETPLALSSLQSGSLAMLLGSFQVRHPGQRRARAVLLWLVLCFAAIQVGLAVAEEWYWPFLRDPDYGYRVMRLRCRLASAQEKPITVVMLGSSRTGNGLRARPLEQELCRQTGRPVILFNFGIPAAGPVLQLLVLNRLLHDGIRPDHVLVEVMPPYLAGPSSTWAVASLPLQRLWHCDLSLVRALDPKHRDRTSRWRKQAWLWPCHAHRANLLSVLVPFLWSGSNPQGLSHQIDDSGWIKPSHGPFSDLARRDWTAKAFRAFAGYWDDSQPGGPSCDALRRLLQRCRDEQIAVKLVLMPEGPIFRSWYSTDAWQAFEEFLEEIQSEFAVEVVNARNWIEEEEFFDSHHLLPPGAERFSERLGREVLTPWLMAPKQSRLRLSATAGPAKPQAAGGMDLR
jgi:hypothetical protein